MQRTRLAVVMWTAATMACGNDGAGVPGVDAPAIGDDARASDAMGDASSDAGLVSLDPTPGTYRGTCDGSGALALGFDHFLDANDEDQKLRVYARATEGGALASIDISAGLGLANSAEADLEDLARIGNRLYATTSDGRKTSGNLDRARYKLAAFDVSGTPPAITLTHIGTTSQLLDHMLVSANWDTPNATVIAALTAASQLNDTSEATLAPENQGTNIEGMTADATGRLLLGFRNPRPGGKAIVVELANTDAALAGATARFVGAVELDLGGLGIRSLAYSPTHGKILILAGPHAGGPPFRVFTWSGVFGEAPVQSVDVTVPATSSAEAIVPYPNTRDVQIVFDQGDVDIGGDPCKDAPAADRVFRDAIVTVN